MLAGYAAFAHLTADRAILYRAILDTFVRAKERFALHLRPADVERALAETDLGETERPIGDAPGPVGRVGKLGSASGYGPPWRSSTDRDTSTS